jgi:hypothetical protein
LAAVLGTALRVTFNLAATLDADLGKGLGDTFFTLPAVDFAVALPFGAFAVPLATLLTVLDFDFAFAVTNFHSPKATC